MDRETFVREAVVQFEAQLRAAVEAVESSRNAAAFVAAERRVHDLTRALADQLVASALRRVCADSVRTREEVERLRSSAPYMDLKLQGKRSTPVMLLGGTIVSIEAQYLLWDPESLAAEDPETLAGSLPAAPPGSG